MRFFILLILTAALLSCSSTNEKATVSSEEGISLIGTWNLISYIDHPNNKTEWQSYPSNILYQKHVTETHFTWVMYDKDQDLMLGMGGGNYQMQDDKYVENIDFFYPPASSELGQSIPFDVAFKDGKWYHTGYAKEMEIDFNTGQMVAGDSNKIEEIWIKASEASASNMDLAGTWDLRRYRDKLTDSYYEYPEMTGYIKLITPTHFAWVKYDKDGDQIYNAGSGTYSFDGQSYVENIEMIFPQGSGQIGTTIDFSLNLTDYQWEHFGYGPRTLDGELDSFLIDEIWTAHVNSIEEEVAVSF